jgi:hypothetical protein
MGMVGIIYANCLNMAIRGVLSMKISLDKLYEITKCEEFTTGKVFIMVLLHKIFIGLCLLGVVGTIVASYLLDYLINFVRK